jgi:hypothetical protein
MEKKVVSAPPLGLKCGTHKIFETDKNERSHFYM